MYSVVGAVASARTRKKGPVTKGMLRKSEGISGSKPFAEAVEAI
jgi:hypothetical protein